MEKITNYLELIQQIQDITPEKRLLYNRQKSYIQPALCFGKRKAGNAKTGEKGIWGTERQKQLRIIQTTCILDQLVEFLACQGTDWIPVILPADATVPVDEWTQKHGLKMPVWQL